MTDYLRRYLPEFDEDALRMRLSSATRDELLNMLVIAYKEKRVFAKELDECTKRLDRIIEIAAAPSTLLNMPDVPTSDDLRRMAEDDNESD